MIFFFSSRRRHTRLQGDWSSDVCSSDLLAVARARGIGLPKEEVARVLGVIDGLPPAMKPSFLVDLETGGPTELDILSGAVSRFAEEAGGRAPPPPNAGGRPPQPPP